MNHTAAPGTGTAPDAAVAALGTAAGQVIASFEGQVPFGAAAGVLGRIEAVHTQIDQLRSAMPAPLAQMEATGELLEEGGQKNIKAYLTHAWGIHAGEAERLALLATGLHQQSLPHTARALAEGALTLGQASAIASGAERLQAALDPYTAPYEGYAPVSKWARTYDALMAAMSMAHGHHGCKTAPGPKALITITVPLSTFMDLHPSAANLQPLCSTHNRLKYRRTTRTRTGKKTGTGAKTPHPPGATGPPGGRGWRW